MNKTKQQATHTHRTYRSMTWHVPGQTTRAIGKYDYMCLGIVTVGLRSKTTKLLMQAVSTVNMHKAWSNGNETPVAFHTELRLST